jgi:hypothetical protein
MISGWGGSIQGTKPTFGNFVVPVRTAVPEPKALLLQAAALLCLALVKRAKA